jgi:uncharacterized DUF497 family protein
VIFEWDEEKRQRNLRKHGVDFADCAQVFAGDTATHVDDRYAYGETRFVTYGMLGGRVIKVVHTERGDFIRVISMRKATKREQAFYFQAFPDRF